MALLPSVLAVAGCGTVGPGAAVLEPPAESVTGGTTKLGVGEILFGDDAALDRLTRDTPVVFRLEIKNGDDEDLEVDLSRARLRVQPRGQAARLLAPLAADTHTLDPAAGLGGPVPGTVTVAAGHVRWVWLMFAGLPEDPPGQPLGLALVVELEDGPVALTLADAERPGRVWLAPPMGSPAEIGNGLVVGPGGTIGATLLQHGGTLALGQLRIDLAGGPAVLARGGVALGGGDLSLRLRLASLVWRAGGARLSPFIGGEGLLAWRARPPDGSGHDLLLFGALGGVELGLGSRRGGVTPFPLQYQPELPARVVVRLAYLRWFGMADDIDLPARGASGMSLSVAVSLWR